MLTNQVRSRLALDYEGELNPQQLAVVRAGGGPILVVAGAGSFHQIGNRFLRRHAPLVGYQPNYTILDREDGQDLMEACVLSMQINSKGSRFPKREVLENLVALSMNP